MNIVDFLDRLENKVYEFTFRNKSGPCAIFVSLPAYRMILCNMNSQPFPFIGIVINEDARLKIFGIPVYECAGLKKHEVHLSISYDNIIY